MIGRTATANGKTRRLVTLGAGAVALTLAASGCVSFYEIPIETPIQAKLDVTPFQRVHVVGFIAGGSDDVDANLETVRLLESLSGDVSCNGAMYDWDTTAHLSVPCNFE